MKRPIILLIMFSFLIVGCRSLDDISLEMIDEYEIENYISEVKEGDFKFELVSENGEYKVGEDVVIYGNIVYEGERSDVTISHASSAVFFAIEERLRDYHLGYMVRDIGIETKLKGKQAYRQSLFKQDIYTDDESSQLQVFTNRLKKDDTFPPGYYLVHGQTDFSYNGDIIKLETNIDFKVKP